MKRNLLLTLGLVASQDTPLWTTTLPPQTMTTVPPNIENSKRCIQADFTHSQGPEPSTGTMCPQYSCYSCCDDDKAKNKLAALYNADGNLKQYGPYHFSGCTAGGAHDTSGAGHMSAQCQAFVNRNFCLSSCSPNVYPFFDTDKKRLNQLPVCGGYCNDFLAACSEELVCLNKDGLKEYLADLIDGTVDPDKDYLMFKCEGNYECKKISDTPIAKAIPADQVPGVIKDAYEKWLEANPQSSSERFCERFTFKMFMHDTKDTCINPRDESTIHAAVKVQEESYNSKNPANQKTFQTSEPCPTGLSVGAIVGIVIGSLAGVGLIAGLVWYFACRSQDEYTQGKDTEEAGTYDMRSTEASGKDKGSIVHSESDYVPPGSIVRSEADYDPSRHASQK